MAKKATSTTNGGTSDEGADILQAAPELLADTTPPAEAAAPAVKSAPAVIKQGVRKITLAQARAHHAKA